MSTKNLARTVIEGGRYNHDKYDRRTSLRWWRKDNKEYCTAIRNGAIDPDEIDAPVRWVDYRWRDEIHADKTKPCERFLASRAGEKWDDVRSEIFTKFNARTLAGQHVIFDHLVRRVEIHRQSWYFLLWNSFGGPKFWVDENGILRHNPKQRY